MNLFSCPECGARGAWKVFNVHNGCPECPVSLDRMRTVDPEPAEPVGRSGGEA